MSICEIICVTWACDFCSGKKVIRHIFRFLLLNSARWIERKTPTITAYILNEWKGKNSKTPNRICAISADGWCACVSIELNDFNFKLISAINIDVLAFMVRKIVNKQNAVGVLIAQSVLITPVRLFHSIYPIESLISIKIHARILRLTNIFWMCVCFTSYSYLNFCLFEKKKGGKATCRHSFNEKERKREKTTATANSQDKRK